MPETDEVLAINYVERVRHACDLWLESGAVSLRLAIGWASSTGDGSWSMRRPWLRIACTRSCVEPHGTTSRRWPARGRNRPSARRSRDARRRRRAPMPLGRILARAARNWPDLAATASIDARPRRDRGGSLPQGQGIHRLCPRRAPDLAPEARTRTREGRAARLGCRCLPLRQGQPGKADRVSRPNPPTSCQRATWSVGRRR